MSVVEMKMLRQMCEVGSEGDLYKLNQLWIMEEIIQGKMDWT